MFEYSQRCEVDNVIKSYINHPGEEAMITACFLTKQMGVRNWDPWLSPEWIKSWHPAKMCYVYGSGNGCLFPGTSHSCQQCQASSGLCWSGTGEASVAANPRENSSASSLARLSCTKTTEMQSTWPICLLDHVNSHKVPHTEMCHRHSYVQAYSVLSLGVCFSFFGFFFSFSSLYKAECDLKLRIDLSVIRPKDVLV